MPELSFKSSFPVTPEELFTWHERPGTLQRLTPPWIRMNVEGAQGIRDGDRAVIHINRGPLSQKWEAVHEDYVFGKQFVDYQETGPFQYWKHVHRFEPHGRSGCQLTDELDIQLPGGSVGDRVASGYLRKEIERVFAYRHRITGQDVLLHKRYNPGKLGWRVGITGASGLIGSELAAFLSAGGHEIVRIVRRRTLGRNYVFWDPDTGEIDRAGLENLDFVVHLAGERVLRWKWEPDTKTKIHDSRTKGTKLLASTLASLSNPPKAFLSASGVAIYGTHGADEVSESSALNQGGFLANVSKEWEDAAAPAAAAGIRTVFLRFGSVLTPRGGVLKKVLPLFLSGLGGRFVPGEQWVSWVSADDAVGATYHAMRSTVSGPINVVSPFPVTIDEAARVLGRVVRRPVLLPVPRRLVQRAFGEVADEVFFESVRAVPEYLSSSSYQFLYPQLEGALRHVLGRAAPRRPDLSVISSESSSMDHLFN